MEQSTAKTLIDFYQANSNKQVHLWTMYVVSTMAGATLGATISNIWIAAAACLGFLTFTIGHAWMIYIVLKV